MTKLGDIIIPEPLFDETYLSIGLSGSIPGNANFTYGIGTYRMPMTGSFSAVVMVGVQFTNGIQDVTGHLGPSTPAANSGFAFQRSGDARDGRTQFMIGKAMYFWSSLASGTTVTLNLNLSTSVYATTISPMWVNGWLRSCKT